MNLRNFAKWTSLFPALALGFAGTAQAHRVVHVEGNLYVIICDNNGGNYTFSGSSQGATDVAGLICPVAIHGGAGGGTVSPIEQATPAQAALQRNKGGTSVKECPAGTHWYEPAKACVANGGHPN